MEIGEPEDSETVKALGFQKLFCDAHFLKDLNAKSLIIRKELRLRPRVHKKSTNICNDNTRAGL